MKNIRVLMILLALAGTLVFMGCEEAGAGGSGDDSGSQSDNADGSDDTDDTNDGGDGANFSVSSVPTKFTVTPPKSLRNSVGSISASQFEDSDSSMAYEQLTETVSEIEDNAAYTSMNFVAIDSVINGLERQAEAYDAQTITITQGMADVISEILSDAFGEGADEADIFGDMVDETIEVGSFTYRNPDSEKYGYAFEGTLTFWDGYESTLSYFWSEDKTRVRAVESISDEMIGDFSVTYTYDGGENRSTVKYEMSGDDPDFGGAFSFESTITMREKADDDANGVFVSFDDRGSESGMSFAYKANGFADDNGGYLESEIEFGGESFSYKEGFDGEGNETYFAEKNEDGEWGDPTISEGFDESVYTEEFATYEFDEDTFDIVLTGATADSYYLVSDVDLGASFDAGSDAEASAIGDALGVDADTVNVLLWEDPTGATYYFYEESESGDSFVYELADTIEEDDLEFVVVDSDSAEGDAAVEDPEGFGSEEEVVSPGEETEPVELFDPDQEEPLSAF